MNKLANGSDTYRAKLDVKEIGLTVSDVLNLGKQDYAEIVTYEKAYSDALSVLNESELAFFCDIDGKGKQDDRKEKKKFRRVEINALTSPELIEFVRSKIKYEAIKPSIEQVRQFVNIDHEAIIKNALYKVFGIEISLNLDADDLASKVVNGINDGEHWTDTLGRVIERHSQELTEQLAGRLKAAFGKH